MVSEIYHEVPVINFGKTSVNITSNFPLPLSLILLFLMFPKLLPRSDCLRAQTPFSPQGELQGCSYLLPGTS